MAAIPRELIESELFGHEKGAFTGALANSAGRFEQAEGGTLFLDEIGDMPLEAQTRLLRVLQDGEYTRVGGRHPKNTDVRIIAATHHNLRRLIQQGLFREDLFFRLNVVPVNLPPLRDRPEDIPELVRHFLIRAADNGLPSKTIDTDAIKILCRYSWPGNVRELENLIQRLAALCPQENIQARDIEEEFENSSVTLSHLKHQFLKMEAWQKRSKINWLNILVLIRKLCQQQAYITGCSEKLKTPFNVNPSSYERQPDQGSTDTWFEP